MNKINKLFCILLFKIINSQSINEAITFKVPIMASVPVTSDDENSLLESDDGVGLGEPRITSKSIVVGYTTLMLNINYGKDFDQIVNTFFIEEKSKLTDKIDTLK